MTHGSITLLRFLSITLVYLYHASVPGFSFGYLGVDAFLVISGYVLYPSLVNVASQKTPLHSFLIKRYFRLIPSLLVVILTTFFLTIPLMSAEQLDTIMQHSLASMVFLENFLLYQTTGYWSQINDFNPYFHLWSLSLEFQIYLLFGLCFKFRIRPFIMLAITISVLFLSLRVENNYEAFYLLPNYRLWEFASGVYLASIRVRQNYSTNLSILLIIIAATTIILPMNLAQHGLACLISIIFIITYNQFFQKYHLNYLSSAEKLVYTIYLIHVPINSILNSLSYQKPSFYSYLLTTPILFALTLSCHNLVQKTNTQKHVYVYIKLITLMLVLTAYLTELNYRLLTPAYNYPTRSANIDLNMLPLNSSWEKAQNPETTIFFVGDSFARDLFNLYKLQGPSEKKIYYEQMISNCTESTFANILAFKFLIVSRRTIPRECYANFAKYAEQHDYHNYMIIGPKDFGYNPGKSYSYLHRDNHTEFLQASPETVDDIQWAEKHLRNKFENIYHILSLPDYKFPTDVNGKPVTFDMIHFSRFAIQYFKEDFTNYVRTLN